MIELQKCWKMENIILILHSETAIYSYNVSVSSAKLYICNSILCFILKFFNDLKRNCLTREE
jgi:hypothetical protein